MNTEPLYYLDEGTEVTWSEFYEVNKDGLLAEELDLIKNLQVGDEYKHPISGITVKRIA
jgi:hypothetical protein